MPFTPFHLGPGALFKAVGGRHFSFMVFGGAQVLMDLEPGLRMMFGMSVLHGWTHTLAGAAIIGSVAAFTGKRVIEIGLRARGKDFTPMKWHASILAAYVGTFSHVLLDGIMHSDMVPWYPLASGNDLLGLISVGALHNLCLVMGVGGGIGILVRNRARKTR